MRISLLLAREPFSQIVEETLAEFWREQHQKEFTVAWHTGRLANGANVQTWFVNPYLNAIFTRDASPDLFEPIQREFARSTIWWKRPLQHTYVTLATRKQSAPWFAKSSLTVIPPLPEAAQLLIVGGNHKLRILNRCQHQVICLLKAGFTPNFWERELTTRQQAITSGIPGPRLLKIGENRRWFVEEYKSGTPINRLPSQQQSNTAMRQVAKSLQLLLSKTSQTRSQQAYLATLQGRIEQLIGQNHLLTSKAKEQLWAVSKGIAMQLEHDPNHQHQTITTALTHGDFQPANILVDQQEAWLIDWEYADDRQSGYDALVFGLAARFPTGLAQRLQQWVQTGWNATASLANLPWPGLQSNDPAKRRLHASFFLLEELILHLEENSQPLLTQLGEGLQKLQIELTQWLEMAPQ